MSDSTCEKSGFTVRSIAVSAFGVYFTSRPTCGFTGALTSGVPRSPLGAADFAGRHIGRGDDVAARRQVLEADERVRSADEAVAAARQLRGKELIVVIARIVAVQQDAPGLGVDVLVAQRRERNPHLERPAARGDLRRRFPEEVGRRILARRIVGDRVVLDAARIGEEHLGAAAVVSRAENDPAVVGEAGDVVAVAERRANRARVGIVELEPGVEKPIVVGEIGDVLHLGLGVVARVDLVPLLDARGAAPAFVGQIAVDR